MPRPYLSLRRFWLPGSLVLLGLLIAAAGWAAAGFPGLRAQPGGGPAQASSLLPGAAHTSQPGPAAEPSQTSTQPALELPTPTLHPPTTTPFSSAAPTPRPAVPITPSPAPGTYTIQPGDTISDIAGRYGIQPLDLMRANHIANPAMIQPGQVLVIPTPPGGAGAVTPQPDKWVLVDLSDQRLYAYQESQLLYTMVVSTGMDDGTLRGRFRVLDKLPYPYSKMWGFYMPFWMGLYYVNNGTVENGIHGLPVLKNGQQIWAETLGQPASTGCVVLTQGDAKTLYNWLSIGTPVTIRD